MTRHRFDPLSFVFGALFVAVAAVGLVDPALVDLPDYVDLRWIAPALLVVLGVLLLLLSGRNGDRDQTGGPDTSDDEQVPADVSVETDRGATGAENGPGTSATTGGALEDDEPER